MISRFIACTALFISTGVFSADFGVGNWGDDRDAILSEETRINITPIGQYDYLVYSTSFGNLDQIKLVYRFQEEILTKGVFIFNSDSMTANAMLNQYNVVKDLLIQKYGPPTEDHIIWSTLPEPEDKSVWSNYLSNNQLILQSEWQSSSTILFHQLSEYNGTIQHQLVYKPLIQVQNSKSDSLF